MIVVTSTAKNAVGHAARCVASVRDQEQTEHDGAWLHFYTAADEPTADDAQSAAGLATRVQRVSPLSSLENLCEMWAKLPGDVIVAWLDGDDELTPGALARVAHYYQRSDVWATYGSFVRDDGMLDYQWAPAFGRRHGPRGPRAERWRASHLRTFRAALVQQVIAGGHLIDPGTGRAFEYSTDCAVMIPLLELCGPRYLAATDVNVVYHWGHSSDQRDPLTTRSEERRILQELERREPLAALTSAPW